MQDVRSFGTTILSVLDSLEKLCVKGITFQLKNNSTGVSYYQDMVTIGLEIKDLHAKKRYKSILIYWRV